MKRTREAGGRRRAPRAARPGGRWVVVTTAVLIAASGVPVGTDSGDLAGGAAPGPASVSGAAAGPTDVLPASGSWTVTLLTGDVIDVRSDAEGRVTAVARERAGPFRTVRLPDGELYVLPLSVTPLLERVLDLELFNVTGLVRQGYDDDSIDVVPLIVQRRPGVDVESELATAGGEQPLPSIGAVATEVPKAHAEATGRGTTWRRASAQQRAVGAYRVKLPSVGTGVSVSLRVDARDAAGNRIEQTLYDAYTR
jgi:hypothetical protein